MQEIDWQVGELMKTLDNLQLTENTLVIFASDNGPQLNVDGHGSAGILRDGKWTNFEGGIRVPCIMRWPGVISAGSTNRDITAIIDLLPTFCEIAGANVPQDRMIDGRSILPYLKGEQAASPIHDTFIVPDSVIRHGRWKLLVKAQKVGGSNSDKRGKTDRVPAKAGSLFDLKEDPGETTDVSTQNPGIVADLKKRMRTAMKNFERESRPAGRVLANPDDKKKSKR